jgi:hypothetical protein
MGLQSELGRIDLHLCGLGAGLDYRGENVLLLLRVALHGGDQVGDEVGAALVLVLDVAPAGFGLLLECRDCVVAATGDQKACQDHGKSARRDDLLTIGYSLGWKRLV